MTARKVTVTPTRVWKFAVTAAVCLALAAFVSALLRSSAAAADSAAVRKLKIFQPVKGPPLGRIARHLLVTPLEPNLLHGLIAHRVSKRGASTMSDAERSALGSLGWQSTPIQIDLILDGIARQDEALVLTRIDGLLRRRKQTTEFISILVQIEQTGSEARAKLVEMLRAKPVWRTDFLRAPAGTANANAILARSATLDALFARRLAPTRDEVAPVVNALVAIGESGRAQSLWQKFHTIDRVPPIPFDPNFAGMAANPLDGEYQPMAYEWRAGEGSGYSVQASLVGDDSAVLNIRWDGRGAPVLLKQKLITPPGRFTITVTGSLLERNAMQRISFVFYCNDAAPVFHDRLLQGRDGEFVFAADEAVICDDPEMGLVGISDQNATAVELELGAIRVRRQTTGS